MDTKETATSPLVVGQTADAVVVGQTLAQSAHADEAKVTSLRRAATVLLIFGLCSGVHLSGWLAALAAVAILCASPAQLHCRARFAKWLCIAVAVLASISFVVHLVMLSKDYPLRFGQAVETQCVGMPAETYLWAKSAMRDLHGHRHQGEEKAAVAERGSRMLETVYALVLSPVIDVDTRQAPLEVKVEQERACHMIARCAYHFGSALLLLASASNLFLLIAAVAVARRVCCLGCCLKRTAVCKPSAAAPPVVVVKPVLA